MVHGPDFGKHCSTKKRFHFITNMFLTVLTSVCSTDGRGGCTRCPRWTGCKEAVDASPCGGYLRHKIVEEEPAKTIRAVFFVSLVYSVTDNSP